MDRACEVRRKRQRGRKRKKEGKRWSSTPPLTPVPVCTSWMACRGAWCSPATGSWTGSWPPVWPPHWRSVNAPRTPALSSPCVSWSQRPSTCSSSSPPCPSLCWASSSGLPCRPSASHTCTPTAGQYGPWYSFFYFLNKSNESNETFSNFYRMPVVLLALVLSKFRPYGH